MIKHYFFIEVGKLFFWKAIETLSSDELEILRREAIGRLDEETKEDAEKFGKLEVIVRMKMEEIIGERLKVEECR